MHQTKWYKGLKLYTKLKNQNTIKKNYFTTRLLFFIIQFNLYKLKMIRCKDINRNQSNIIVVKVKT